MERTLYDVLGVPQTATIKDIEKAYKKQALRCHPDRSTGDKNEATENFQRLAEAYETLKDDRLRQRYDLSLTRSSTYETALARTDSYKRSPSSSPPNRTYGPSDDPSSARNSSSRGAPNARTMRAPPLRMRNIDPFQVFKDAWGKSLEEIEREIDRRAFGPEYASSGTTDFPNTRGAHGAGSRQPSWDQHTPGYRPPPLPRRESSMGAGVGGMPGERERRDSRTPAVDPFMRSRQELGRRRSQSASLGPETVKEIHQTVITVERSASGVHMKREIKSRTLTEDGMLHDRYRRTRAGIEYDEPQQPAPKLSQPQPRNGYPSRREERDAEAPYRRPSYVDSYPETRRPGFVRSPTSSGGSDIRSLSAASTAATSPGLPSAPASRARTPMPLSRSGSQQQVAPHSMPSQFGRPRTRSMVGPRPTSFHGGMF